MLYYNEIVVFSLILLEQKLFYTRRLFKNLLTGSSENSSLGLAQTAT